MLTTENIQKALVALVEQKAGLPYDVIFDHVNKSDPPYIWIDMRPQKRSWDGAYFQRLLGVEIHVVLAPDADGEVKHTELFAVADALDAAVMPCLKIEDRFITVQEFSSYIFDDVLHYEFTLDFTDYVASAAYEGADYELMRKLEVDLNKGTSERVFITSEGDD